ncbi:MAG: BadF/BadG/BcrA/BcrD ATPase family protein, partial [Christensenellales bacterium]
MDLIFINLNTDGFDLGVDVGSTTIKFALLYRGNLVFHSYKRHFSNIKTAFLNGLGEIKSLFGNENFCHIIDSINNNLNVNTNNNININNNCNNLNNNINNNSNILNIKINNYSNCNLINNNSYCKLNNDSTCNTINNNANSNINNNTINNNSTLQNGNDSTLKINNKTASNNLDGVEIRVAISGSAGLGLANAINLPFVQEVFATSELVKALGDDINVVIELGGEDAKVIFFENGIDERMNGSCAGGTGAFIDQMAVLMDVSNEELDELSLRSE